MSAFDNSRLITPPREEEEIYPYRRAWRSVFIESGILVLVSLMMYVLFGILDVAVPNTVQWIGNILIALLPTGLWILFSRVPEDFAVEPRRRLLTTFTVSALVANAIGIPFLNSVIQADQWLPLASTLNRIIGYGATVAAVHELLKYFVVRYIAWPDYYRTRTDSIAYSVAGAVGYVTVINLNFLVNSPETSLDATALTILGNTTLHVLTSIFIAYGLSESFFSDAVALLQPSMFIVASLLHGVFLAMRPSFVNATLGFTISSQRDIFGLIFTLIFYGMLLAVIYFLFDVAERRSQDKATI